MEYPYDFSSTDPDNDKIKYVINWDDSNTDTTDFYDSRITITVKHNWIEKGTYTNKAKARDENDAESYWAALSVSIPKTTPINPLFLKIVECLTQHFTLLAGLLQILVFEKLTNPQ